MNNTKKKPVKKLKDFKKPKLDPENVNETALIETGKKEYYSNFEVRPAGNHNEVYPPSGYSKYMLRWTAFQDKKLTHPEQIYGLPQALEHIEELRKHEELKDKDFEVVEVTILKTAYKTKKG